MVPLSLFIDEIWMVRSKYNFVLCLQVFTCLVSQALKLCKARMVIILFTPGRHDV